MKSELRRIALADLGVLRVAGADAVRFLQGQLSNDLTRLGPERSLLAGYHTPQGRTIALVRLISLGEDAILAILPRELVAAVAQRLAKYVLRSKVTLADASAQWHIEGLAAPAATDALPVPTHAQRHDGATVLVCVGEEPARWLSLAPGAGSAASAADREWWRALDVRAGMPQVYAATSEQFVAQMLNLDAIGAIAFDKGCYTGQEVIARAHYRGRVKRRLQRFASRGALSLSPGDGGTLADGRSFSVVEAAQRGDGRCEFLAVAPLAGAQPESSVPAEGAHPVDAEPLALPYAIAD